MSSRMCCSTPEDSDEATAEVDTDAERATATILFCLEKHVERFLESICNLVHLWAKLKNIYERNGFSTHFYLWQMLFTVQLADCHKPELKGYPMDLDLDAYRSHVKQLRSSGATDSNKIEASAVLNGLE
jgi:hypothetical protein